MKLVCCKIVDALFNVADVLCLTIVATFQETNMIRSAQMLELESLFALFRVSLPARANDNEDSYM